jgi:hypothetical protein
VISFASIFCLKRKKRRLSNQDEGWKGLRKCLQQLLWADTRDQSRCQVLGDAWLQSLQRSALLVRRTDGATEKVSERSFLHVVEVQNRRPSTAIPRWRERALKQNVRCKSVVVVLLT